MRFLNWPELLQAAIEDAQQREYSEHYYCAVFAADCVLAMTGVDYLEEFRDMTAGEAEEAMRAAYGTLTVALNAILGSAKPIAFAQRGDVVLRDTDDNGQAIGICLGQESAFISSEGGLAIYRTLECRAAYAI